MEREVDWNKMLQAEKNFNHYTSLLMKAALTQLDEGDFRLDMWSAISRLAKIAEDHLKCM
jgi:hypothetical protein